MFKHLDDRTLSPPWLPLGIDGVVTLSREAQGQCAVLAPIFDARNVDEVVAAAVAFAFDVYATPEVKEAAS
jgi:hypothetical protein